MKQQQFETEYTALWEQIQLILSDKSPAPIAFPALYRRLCQSLALAIQRGYSPALSDYLQKMVFDCHRRLYGAAAVRPLTLRRWLMLDFPQRVRAEWRLLCLALLAFWGVALAVGLLVWFMPHWATSFITPQQLNHYQSMYQPGQLRIGRGAEGDLMMFGFYIWNNVSIDFRTFAGGIFGGIPALFSMAFNGMHMGVLAIWLSQDPATRITFWSFVITHSSFEVAGLLLSGMAGAKLGWALISPGRCSRRHAMLEASQKMFPVIVGAALLTVLAAFFEAFWSANPALPVPLKMGVGAGCWLLVIGFFTLAGRAKK